MNLDRLLDYRVIGAVSVNFIPLAGIFLFGWDAFSLLLLYWTENIIVGVVTVAKMMSGSALRDPRHLFAAAPVSGFFVLHYGIFCFVHGIFVWAIISTDHAIATDVNGPISMAEAVYGHMLAVGSFWWAVVLLSAAHGGLYLFWLISCEWRHTHPLKEFARPYIRIVLLHVTILVAAIPVMILGSPIAGVAILAIIKTLMETFYATRYQFPLAEGFEADDTKASLNGLFKK